MNTHEPSNEHLNADLNAVIEAIKNAPENSKVYVGCDSSNSKKYTTFVTVIVLHYAGRNGARVFPFFHREKRFHHRNHRLITEAHLATYKALELIGAIPELADNIEVHLDLNPSPRHKSHVVVKEALAFVKGQGLTPRIKPDALAASSASDYLGRKDRMVLKRDLVS